MERLPPHAHLATRPPVGMASRPLLAPMGTPPFPAPVLGSRASLYVGDLERGVAEGQLYTIFSEVARVASLRVCRDMAGRSLGYGYVNFYSREEAKHALDSLNFIRVNGKSIRVMFSNRDPILRNNGHANVFIKNIGPNIDNKGLNDLFSGFGTILSCKVATDLNGRSKGYGFVQFEDEKSAKEAINVLNGMLYNERILVVCIFIRRQERQHIFGMRKFTNVYIKNLPMEFNEDDLHQQFAPFGDITSAVIIRDADGKSRCFGFVNYGKPECATEAIKNLNGKMVKDMNLYVGRAQKKEERQAELRAKFERDRTEKFKRFEGLNLYIKHLDYSIDDVQLRNLFENFGEIASCKVMVDSQGRSMGYGFVAFQSVEAVQKAIEEMNGKMIGRKPLHVCLAQRKEERRAILVAHFARLQNVGLAPAVPHNIAPNQFYPGPVAPVTISPQFSSFGYQHYMQPQIYPLISLGGPNVMIPYNMMRPMHHGQRVGVWRGVCRQIHRQHERVHPNANQDITYFPHQRNQPANAGMAPLDFSTPVEAEGLALTNTTDPDIDVTDSNNLTTSPASADQENQHQILGKKLYQLVEQLEPEFTAKVTQILLDLDDTEVRHLIESANDLREKVSQATEALRRRKSEETGDNASLTCTPSSSGSSSDATDPVHHRPEVLEQ